MSALSKTLCGRRVDCVKDAENDLSIVGGTAKVIHFLFQLISVLEHPIRCLEELLFNTLVADIVGAVIFLSLVFSHRQFAFGTIHLDPSLPFVFRNKCFVS